MKSPTLFRPLFFTLLMLLAATLAAQPSENDYRKTIPYGAFHVAPDGTVWNAAGNREIYKLAPGDSLWRSRRFYIDGSTAIKWPNDWEDGQRMFFSCDSTILLFNTDGGEKVKYYRSTDNGKTWVKLSFPNPDKNYVRCVYARNGRIWLSQPCGSLFFSGDNGLTFKSIPSAVVIPRHCYDMSFISMLADGQHGLTSGGHSHIFLTDDNWQTATKLDSPLDLDLLPNSPDYSDTRIYDLLYWHDFLFIDQNGCCFYTEVGDTARWRPLPVATGSFMEDTARNLLAITTKDGYLLLTADLRKFDTIRRFSVTGGGKLIGVTDDQYYIRNESQLFIVSGEKIRTCEFYTDEPISISVYGCKDTVSGHYFYRDYRTLYHFDKKRNQWYRIKTPLKSIPDILPYKKSSNIVMLSDGYHNYLFDIKKQTFTPFRYEHPLKDFLKHPIDSIRITATSSGCFHGIFESVKYTRNGDQFVSQKNPVRQGWNAEDSVADRCFKEFSKTFPAAMLDSMLNNLDEHYDMGLSWAMFDITPADIDSMRATIGGPEFWTYRIRKDSASLQWAGDTLLQLSDSLLTAIVLPCGSGGCTTADILTICFTNSKNKELTIERVDAHCSTGSVPYMLPGKIVYNGKTFYISYIPFMEFVSTLMPEKMITRDKFTVHELLCKVARYLLEW